MCVCACVSLRIYATFQLHTHTCLHEMWHIHANTMTWLQQTQIQWVIICNYHSQWMDWARVQQAVALQRCASYVWTFTVAVPLHQINWPVWFWLDLESCGTLTCQPSFEVKTHFTLLHTCSPYLSLCKMRSRLWRMDLESWYRLLSLLRSLFILF